MFRPILTAACLVLAAPAIADEHGATGNAEAGEKAFRQCIACHVVTNAAGETLAGKAGRTGPNLYGVAGRAAGSVEGFNYSKSMKAAAESGLVWTEENFVAYIQDPLGFLKEVTNDPGAKTPMTFKVRKEEDARDLYAFLASLADE